MVSSTDSSNLAKAISLSFFPPHRGCTCAPAQSSQSRRDIFFRASSSLNSEVPASAALSLCQNPSNEGDLSSFILPPLSFHCQSHLPRRPLDCSHRAFEISGIEVGHFCFRDLFDLGARYLADLLFLGTAGAFFDRRRLLQKVRRRRRFRFKGKRA